MEIFYCKNLLNFSIKNKEAIFSVICAYDVRIGGDVKRKRAGKDSDVGVVYLVRAKAFSDIVF